MDQFDLAISALTSEREYCILNMESDPEFFDAKLTSINLAIKFLAANQNAFIV